MSTAQQRARSVAALRQAAGGTAKRDRPVLDAYLQRVNQFGNGTQALALRERFNTDSELIRNSEQFTEVGKRVEIAKRYVDTRRQLDILREQFRAAVETERAQLQRGLFGPLDTSPETMASHRAAHTLAQQLDSKDDALKELRWAHLMNDEAYARAIVYRATQEGAWNSPLGWGEVIDAHNQKYPGTVPTLQEIDELPDNSTLQENMVFGLPAPMELSTMDPTADPLRYAERLIASTEEPVGTEGSSPHSGVPITDRMG